MHAGVEGVPHGNAAASDEGLSRESHDFPENSDFGERDRTVLGKVIADVSSRKVVLDDPSSSVEALLDALGKLRAMGALQTRVLSSTQVGKSANDLAKTTTFEAVRTEAKELVEQWRQMHRKRKADVANASEPTDRAPPTSDSTASASNTVDVQKETLHGKSDPDPYANSKAEAACDSSKPVADLETLTAQRKTVLLKLVQALGLSEARKTKNEASMSRRSEEQAMRDPFIVAREVEEALAATLSESEYNSQARSILFNLRDKTNDCFGRKLLLGHFSKELIPKLTATDMASDEKHVERKLLRKDSMEEVDFDWAAKKGQLNITGTFTCGKCNGTQTTYYQMQTRSSDEPMTTFVTCLTCSYRWKFC